MSMSNRQTVTMDDLLPYYAAQARELLAKKQSMQVSPYMLKNFSLNVKVYRLIYSETDVDFEKAKQYFSQIKSRAEAHLQVLLNHPDADNKTLPLLFACQHNQINKVDLLLRYGADHEQANDLLDPTNILFKAINEGHFELAKLLINKNLCLKYSVQLVPNISSAHFASDAENKITHPNLATNTTTVISDLFFYPYRHNYPIVIEVGPFEQVLISSRFNVEQKMSLLILLQEKGIQVNRKTQVPYYPAITPIMLAKIKQEPELVDFLLSIGAEDLPVPQFIAEDVHPVLLISAYQNLPKTSDIQPEMMLSHDSFNQFKQFMESGNEIGEIRSLFNRIMQRYGKLHLKNMLYHFNEAESGPAELFVSHGHLHIMKVCLEFGIDFNDYHGYPLLDNALFNRQVEMAKLMIENEINVAQSYLMTSPCGESFIAYFAGVLEMLIMAEKLSSAEKIALIKIALEKGMDINRESQNGSLYKITPFVLAKIAGDQQVLDFLIAKGAKHEPLPVIDAKNLKDQSKRNYGYLINQQISDESSLLKEINSIQAADEMLALFKALMIRDEIVKLTFNTNHPHYAEFAKFLTELDDKYQKHNFAYAKKINNYIEVEYELLITSKQSKVVITPILNYLETHYLSKLKQTIQTLKAEKNKTLSNQPTRVENNQNRIVSTATDQGYVNEKRIAQAASPGSIKSKNKKKKKAKHRQGKNQQTTTSQQTQAQTTTALHHSGHTTSSVYKEPLPPAHTAEDIATAERVKERMKNNTIHTFFANEEVQRADDANQASPPAQPNWINHYCEGDKTITEFMLGNRIAVNREQLAYVVKVNQHLHLNKQQFTAADMAYYYGLLQLIECTNKLFDGDSRFQKIMTTSQLAQLRECLKPDFVYALSGENLIAFNQFLTQIKGKLIANLMGIVNGYDNPHQVVRLIQLDAEERKTLYDFIHKKDQVHENEKMVSVAQLGEFSKTATSRVSPSYKRNIKEKIKPLLDAFAESLSQLNLNNRLRASYLQAKMKYLILSLDALARKIYAKQDDELLPLKQARDQFAHIMENEKSDLARDLAKDNVVLQSQALANALKILRDRVCGTNPAAQAENNAQAKAPGPNLGTH